MSWSVQTGVIDKIAAEKAVESLSFAQLPSHDSCVDGAMYDQLQAAKRAAQELLKTVPGPMVSVSLSGHANAIGWQEKAGYANDCITVTVGQHIRRLN